MTRKYALTILIILMLMLGVVALYLQLAIEREEQAQAKFEQAQQELKQSESENARLRQEYEAMLHDLKADNWELQQEINYILEYEREVIAAMQGWLEEWKVMESEITGYAPLDPRAIEGWDYEGDPNITASGEKVVIGETAAGPPDIEFGTLAYLPERKDWRVITDRGGDVQYNDVGMPQFDLAVKSKEEARAIGRTTTKVVYQR